MCPNIYRDEVFVKKKSRSARNKREKNHNFYKYGKKVLSGMSSQLSSLISFHSRMAAGCDRHFRVSEFDASN